MVNDQTINSEWCVIMMWFVRMHFKLAESLVPVVWDKKVARKPELICTPMRVDQHEFTVKTKAQNHFVVVFRKEILACRTSLLSSIDRSEPR